MVGSHPGGGEGRLKVVGVYTRVVLAHPPMLVNGWSSTEEKLCCTAVVIHYCEQSQNHTSFTTPCGCVLLPRPHPQVEKLSALLGVVGTEYTCETAGYFWLLHVLSR